MVRLKVLLLYILVRLPVNFNSSMVRLKVGNNEIISKINQNFNSSMVRLKALLGIACELRNI